MKRLLFSILALYLCITSFAANLESDNKVIYYISSDGSVVTPTRTDVFGTYIISNTYENGQGKILFEFEVTSIGIGAFENCSGLTSITIPSSVTSIGFRAFAGCFGLTSITIPSSVTSIGIGAFYWCSGLTSITIPSSVTSIGTGAFYYCLGLTNITIPSSVNSIGYDAFRCCTGLTSIAVESSNSTYDSRDNCNAIIETASNTLKLGCQKTVIPSSVTSIGDCAFESCYDLTSITIPSSVTSIGDCAFESCYGLTSITNLASTPQAITSSTFTSQDTLHVLPGCGDAYRAADVWKDFNVILEDAVDETGINRVENEESVSPYYSIDGSSVAMPASPGIYIRNKKKLLIR